MSSPSPSASASPASLPPALTSTSSSPALVGCAAASDVVVAPDSRRRPPLRPAEPADAPSTERPLDEPRDDVDSASDKPRAEGCGVAADAETDPPPRPQGRLRCCFCLQPGSSSATRGPTRSAPLACAAGPPRRQSHPSLLSARRQGQTPSYSPAFRTPWQSHSAWCATGLLGRARRRHRRLRRLPWTRCATRRRRSSLPYAPQAGRGRPRPWVGTGLPVRRGIRGRAHSSLGRLAGQLTMTTTLCGPYPRRHRRHLLLRRLWRRQRRQRLWRHLRLRLRRLFQRLPPATGPHRSAR